MPDAPSINVQRDLFLPGHDGLAVYAQNPSYTSVDGRSLIISVKEEGLHFDNQGRRVYYHRRMYRRRSDDNGATWRSDPPLHEEDPTNRAGTQRTVPAHVLDPRRDVLICVHCTYEVDTGEAIFARGNRIQRTYRPWYSLSRDGGVTWSPAKVIVDKRPGYDDTRFGPGLTYGVTGAVADMASSMWLDGGSLVIGFTATNADADRDSGAEHGNGVVYVRANWNADGTDFQWQYGDIIRVAPDQAVGGCCEPAATHLGGTSLFNVMRCQGSEERGIPSSRFCTRSNDGGMTWSPPAVLTYEDGETVWTPASYSAFFTSSKTGHTYWLANILDTPTYDQMPRYPLTVARFDRERCCIMRDSVRVIQNRAPGTPEQVRYTNWGMHEDRDTGDLILYLPEQPKLMDFTAMTRPEDFVADCHRYRVTIE